MNKKLLPPSIFKLTLFFSLLCIQSNAWSQGYLHAEGKYIYDGNGNEVILRGIGTGNWMIQEGYMMQTSGVAGTQHEFRQKLEATIGKTLTDSFYTVWLDNHMTKTDIDSLKAWGFNSIRPALHYLWFTPPIEDEPIAGEITWLPKGFELLDSLISWCTANEMYLILDMHGTPGGQGKDSNISDYDPSKPSLWEDVKNREKLVALWRKIAERCATEPCIGGYDLINETNWTFTEANNSPLWNLFKLITTSIREVDANHLIILEGNWFANDYSGLPTIWDNNMALSFHKYWTYNNANSLDWMINLRSQRNVPIWLGESGENSNTWFTELISLAESKHIGWSWWPVKKPGINNVLKSTANADYLNLIKYWKGDVTKPTVDEAFQAVLTFARNQKFENCTIQRDVIDAVIRQPNSQEVIPFKSHVAGEPLFFTDYDLGRSNKAYFDTDTANYQGSTDVFTAWNTGYAYRNDGVDIGECSDSENSNGYNIGWTATGEWMQYTVWVDSAAGYQIDVRHASGSSGSKIHFEVNNVDISGTLTLPGTGGWQTWKTATFNGLLFPAGLNKIKLVFDQGGSNLNYFTIKNPTAIDSIDFVFLSAETSILGDEIYVNLNKEPTIPVNEIGLSDFQLMVDLAPMDIAEISKQVSTTVLVLKPVSKLAFNNSINLSYNGTSVQSGSQNLIPFSNKPVKNKLPTRHLIPGKIQAEDFDINHGLELETCTDTGGGQNTGFADNGDYLNYLVWVKSTGTYQFDFRVACTSANRQLTVQLADGNAVESLGTITFTSTGGWQTWTTQSINIPLTEGEHTLRLYVKQGEFNLNWFNTKIVTGVDEVLNRKQFSIYPNPSKELLNLKFHDNQWLHSTVEIISTTGNLVLNTEIVSENQVIDIAAISPGMYCIKVTKGNLKFVDRFIKE
ncbi:MAG: carbohydrate-binding protein [Salinivirgaceae bacterium]